MRSPVWDKKIAREVGDLVVKGGSYLIDFEKPRKDWIVWTNGVSAPCYLNCRYLTPNPSVYQPILDFLESLARVEFKEAELVVGLSTAGMFWGAALASRLNLPFAYVRNQEKEHGTGGLVEGKPREGSRALVIDDVCASGGSLIKAIEALKKECSIQTTGVATIAAVSDWDSKNRWGELKEKGVVLRTLTDHLFVQEAALEAGRLTKAQHQKLCEFYKNPKGYEWS